MKFQDKSIGLFVTPTVQAGETKENSWSREEQMISELSPRPPLMTMFCALRVDADRVEGK